MFKGKNKLKTVAILAVGALSVLAQDDFEAQMRALEAQLGVVEETARANHTQIDGIMVPGNNLAEKLTWLQRSAESHNTYILEIRSNQNIAPQTLHFRGAINITLVLRGDSQNRTIRLSSHGAMFTINQDVTLILDNNITLNGHNGNNSTVVLVNGGNLVMNNGATITGNHSGGHGGAGVDVQAGSFMMNGGTISNNRTGSNGGGGVCVCGSGVFTMNGGTISRNHSAHASGRGGGGVMTTGRGRFYMRGGVISNNIADGHGGGVYRSDGSHFTMSNGNITNNTARQNGGGVFIQTGWSGGSFIKTGGTITGHSSDRENGNVVRDDEGILARRGHAVWADENRRRERTAGPDVRMGTGTNEVQGSWEN